jgi:protein-S-isoprenylcysteine O-methyltransferase Ste14
VNSTSERKSITTERKIIMSIVPIFEIGIWNAWILMVIFYAAAFIPLAINNEKAEKRMEGEPTGNEQKKVTKIVNAITHMVIMPLTLIYSIFLPIKLGTWWFYSGLLIYLIGTIMVLLFSISFATAPLGEPLSKGVYAFSRHPNYFGFFLAYAGIGSACASWIFLLCAFVWIVSWQFGVAEEERVLLEKYGEAYQQYMDQTPRWIGFPKRSRR